MEITPISYAKASELLNCKYTTIASAVDRGVFTRLPVTGPEQRIIQKQVELFVGKKQLKLAALSREERKIWDEIDEQVNSTTSASQQDEKKVGERMAKQIAADLALYLMDKALRGEMQLPRIPLEEKLAPFVDKGSLSDLTTLLEMLEVAAKNHNEKLMADIVDRILTPLDNAPYQIFYDVIFHIAAILQEHQCLHEMTVIRESLIAA